MIAWDVAVLAFMALYFSDIPRLDPDSALFPRLMGYPVVAFALLSLGVQTLPQLARIRYAGAEGPDRIRVRRLAVAVLLPIVYLLLWEPLGFQLDTLAFLTVAPALLGFRRPVALVSVAIAVAVLFAFLFHLGSGAILPSGVLHVEWP